MTVLAAVPATVIGMLLLGGFSVVVTRGESMLPALHRGELAVVRAEDRYRVGDVVAYRSPTLGITVLHRVVEVRDDRYLTSGDNNDWLDPDHPSAAEVSGRLVAHVPRLGTAVESLRTPTGALLTGLFVLTTIAVPAARHGRTRSRRGRMSPREKSPTRPAPGAGAVGAVAVVAALAVAAVWLAPAASTSAAPSASGDTVTTTYTGTADAGATYPDGRVGTGDPVFLSLVRSLTFTVTHDAPGPMAVDVRLEHPSGWRHAVPTAGDAAGGLTVDLAAVTAVLAAFAAETGQPATGTGLAVVSTVDGWSTRAGFTVDGSQLRPDPAGFTAVRPVAATVAVRGGPAVLAPLGTLLPGSAARTVATLALLAAAAAAAALSMARRRAAADPLRTRRVLQVAGHTPGQGRTVVDLPDAAQLGRVADQDDLPIFGSPGQFFVDDGAVIYRYRPQPDGPAVDRFADRVADRVAAEVVGRIAREFRTPLATIQGYAELLREQEPGIPADPAMVAAIERGATRLHHMIDQVTVLAGLEAPDRASVGRVDVRDLVDAAAVPVAGARRVTVDVAGGLPTIRGDRDRLAWAMTALLGSPDAAAEVSLRAGRAGDEVVFTLDGVGETGPLADGQLARSLALAVIDRHGGSATTTGATTTIRLPVPA
jgi:signal peptidase I